MFMTKTRSTRSIAALILTITLGTVAHGQTAASPTAAPSNPQIKGLIDHGAMMFQGVKRWLVASAEKMPEDKYAFKPAAEVRTYGQIVGHVADQNYRFCSLARGESNPNAAKIEQTKTAKTDLIAALKESLAYCEAAYGKLTEANALQGVKLGPIEHPRIALLGVNVAHSSLHYGNLVTYMRLNNIVPPSSELGGTAPPPRAND